ncbi:hypothetical protein F5Y01DRAFT_299330 [Xylaria sp. FL0043]|nr:hypothetical protein F5Y01DRAFT_299330 [Xylaria sp. FL0043]
MAHPATYITVSTIVLSIIALISVGLRFLARIKQGANLAQDDFLLLAGLIFMLGLGVCTVLAVYLGHLGRHVVVDAEGMPEYGEWLRRFWQIEWAGQLVSIIGFTLIKASLVLLYRRIFRGDRFKLVSTILLVVIYSWGISFFFAVLLECKPVSQVLLAPQERTGHCSSPAPIVQGMAIANLIIDIAILATPQPIVWKLHMPLKQRLAVSFIFLLGSLVVAIGAVRVYYYFAVNEDLEKKLFDIAWYHAPAFYWTNFDGCGKSYFRSF